MVSAGLDERPGRLGDYVLEELVAEGGMSRVFVGRDPAGRRCAVKSHRAGVVGAREALLREMELLSGLVHPGVVRLIDDGRAVAGSWYAMELVDGGTLRDRMAGPQTEVLGQLRDVCLTLAWLHGRGIVHRDLKPENVLVRGTGAPVLADFGVVGHFAGAAGRERVDGGHGGGTVAYMAPELWAGGTVDARADLAAGRSPSSRLYQTRRARDRDVATTVLLDLSLSSDSWIRGERVLDVSREAVLVLGEVADRLGDRLQILGFASSTRHRVRVWSVRDWHEPWSVGRRALGRLVPQG